MEQLPTDRLNRFVAEAAQIIESRQYKKVVLQLPKEMLSLSFDIVAKIKKKYANTQLFVLYDSLKQSCCLDLLGAEHLGYDGFIHFGKACFSSPHQTNHHYIFEQPQHERLEQIKTLLRSAHLQAELTKHNIGYLLLDQPYYEPIKAFILADQTLNKTIQILKLTYDAQQGNQYLIFGYYFSQNTQINKNILIIGQIEQQQYSPDMNIYEQVAFTLKKLKNKIGQSLFYLGEQGLLEYTVSSSKRLMQRYSMISQLENHEVFGIIISNTATTFFQASLDKCVSILKKHHKKVYIFMMNNLNQVKLGNFPEIQVYVVISCFNHSLFSVKDFHRLVVIPTDLQIAFQHRNFEEYLFDEKADQYFPEKKQEEQIKLEHQVENLQLQVMGSKQVILKNKIQTLDYYREREYKGLVFAQKKQVKKMTKGKVGSAQQYAPLQ